MTKSKTTFTQAFSGFLIILALMAIFSLIGGSSASSQSGDNGEKLVTIEAGTYVFDDLVPHYRWPEENIPLFFTCSWVDSSGTLVYTEAKSINFYRDVIMGEHVWNIMDYGFTTYMYGDESQLDKGWVSVHKCVSRPGLNVCEEEWGDEGYKTIVVPYDQQVSQAAGKWIDIYLNRVENSEDDSGNTDNPGSDSGNTDNGGSFVETPEYKENIIYAGTYMFNDVLIAPTFEGQFDIDFTFSATLPEEPFSTANFVAERLDITLVEADNFILMPYLLSSEPTIVDLELPSNVMIYHTAFDGWLFGEPTLITVTTDTEVDEAFYTWFTENTQMLIEAGTYRWNDDIIFADVYADLTYTVKGRIDEDSGEFFPDMYAIYEQIYTSTPNFIFYDFPVYSESHKWNNLYIAVKELLSYDNPEIKGYGQIFTVTKDTNVPVDFGTWFTCNAAKSVSEASEATATVLDINFTQVCLPHTNKHDLMCA